MPRIACLVVPLFPLAARLRAEPELAGEAIAVVEGSGPAARVVAATRAARRAGIAPGATLAQARALVPRLVARGRDAECERAAREALTEAAERFSPRVEEVEAGAVCLDVDGAARRFRGRTPERDLGLALQREAARTGLPARVGVASSRLAATVAAREARANDPRVVAEGEEAEFLAPLPIARLDPGLDLAERLARWGLASIGDLARLPADEVASRLGEEGRRLSAIARGLDPRPLQPREPLPTSARESSSSGRSRRSSPSSSSRARRSTASAAGSKERGSAARGSRSRSRSSRRGSTRARSSCRRRRATRRRSSRSSAWRSRSDRRAPPSSASPSSPTPTSRARRSSRCSGRPPSPPTAWPPPSRASSRSSARGASARPGRSTATAPSVSVSSPSRPPAAARRRRGAAAARPACRPHAAPPLALEVRLDRAERPESLAPRDDGDGKRPKIEGRVKIAAGPWRLEEGWWSDAPTDREYWDVELEPAGLFRIFRELPGGGWYADGVYD